MDQDLTEELYFSTESSDLEDEDSGNESKDTGNQWSWDLHAGMKLSCQHGHASDDEVDLEVKDDLPYGAATEVNSAMVELMWELGDDDPCDVDWLPAKMHKPEPGNKGMSPTLEPR